jgi:hypothetical protein
MAFLSRISEFHPLTGRCVRAAKHGRYMALNIGGARMNKPKEKYWKITSQDVGTSRGVRRKEIIARILTSECS